MLELWPLENPTVSLGHARLPASAALFICTIGLFKTPPPCPVTGASPSSLLTVVLLAACINKGRRGLGSVKCSDN